MFIKSIITGTLITAVLVAVLAATRLMDNNKKAEEIKIFDITEVFIDPAPEPPMEEVEEQETVEDLPQPPIPKLDLVQNVELDVVSLPLTTASFRPDLAVDPFEIDRAPADLPIPPKPKIVPKAKPIQKTIPKPKYKTPTKPKYVAPTKPKYKAPPKKYTPPPPPVAKAYYSTGDLDSIPKAIRQGSFTWPSRAKGTAGTVKLFLEISSSGKVKVISVISSTDPNLISPAKRVATGSRYTSPISSGKTVKWRFYKTYHLKKP